MRDPQVTRTLLAGQDRASATTITTALATATTTFDIVRADDLPAALDALHHQRFDLVLVDATVLGAQGMAGLDALRILAAGAPIVVLTSQDDAATRPPPWSTAPPPSSSTPRRNGCSRSSTMRSGPRPSSRP